MSRRGVLAALGASTLAVATRARTASAGLKDAPRLPATRTVHDLTHTLSATFPVFPGFAAFQLVKKYTIAHDHYNANELTYLEHTGTHLDAPFHFNANGHAAQEIPVRNLVAPLVVISVVDRAARDPDTVVRVDDVRRWEARYGRIPAGAFVAMHSGWASRVDTPGAFANADAQGKLHFPGFAGDTAQFLTTERSIVGVGVDTLSLDPGTSQDYATHVTVLGANKYGIESLASLDLVPPSGATLVVGGPKHAGGSGGPARVLALS